MGVSRGWTKTQDSSINCNGPELKNDGKGLPGTLHLVVGSSCFYIRFWWEALLWVSAVVPMRSSYRKELEKVKDDVEAVSHAERSVGESLHAGRDGLECEDREEKDRSEVEKPWGEF